MTERTYGENIGKAPITVRHADLIRWSENSPYKSKCPVCPDGVLLIRRDPDSGALEELDFCIACGQAVVYGDIGNLR